MKQTTEPIETIEPAENDATSNKKELIIGAVVILIVIAIIATIAMLINNSISKVDYQPTVACEAFTLSEAKELMGDGTLGSSVEAPVQTKDVATSECGYTDGNNDTDNLIVAAVRIRSGVNDKGVEQNRTEFDAGMPSQNVLSVTDLGDKAYFNETNSQLNVLDGYNWFIVTYGPGAAPESGTLEDAVELAKKVLN